MRPHHGQTLQLALQRHSQRTQWVVRSEVDECSGGAVGLDRFQVRSRAAALVALSPGPIEPAVGMDEPFAERGYHRHAPTRMAVRKQLRFRKVEEPEIL